MKALSLLLTISLAAFTLSWQSPPPPCKNSAYIWNQVQKAYDPGDQWGEAKLRIHIQEPRVGNPQRFTRLQMDNARGYFEMDRNQGEVIMTRIITGEGEAQFALDGETNLSQEQIDTYDLTLGRNQRHKNFYQAMYGMPMSIREADWINIEPAQAIEFEGKEAYSIRLERKEPLITKHWTLITSRQMDKILAIVFNHPEEPDHEEEILKFEGEYEVNGISIPRIRNWYIRQTGEYLGSDIVVMELD